MFVKVVCIDKFLRNIGEIDADIFGAVQWILEVTFADVKGDVFGALARDYTVDYEFEYIN